MLSNTKILESIGIQGMLALKMKKGGVSLLSYLIAEGLELHGAAQPQGAAVMASALGVGAGASIVITIALSIF
jgi:hypothetical protein